MTGPAQPPARGEDGAPLFDRQTVLDQLGGWRGMLDATLPTVAFVVANSFAGLRAGVWAAGVAAVLIFVLRAARRESVQQALSGLVGVAIAVAIASWTGQARDYFVPGIIRNSVIALVLLGSVLLRRPVVGYVAEFLAPSHLGSMASASLPVLRGRGDRAATRLPHGPSTAAPAASPPDPERHWREDPRVLRAYGWLTVLWGATFALRVVVQTPLYLQDRVELLGTVSLVLGLPVTAVALVISLWVVARLHRHRAEPGPRPAA